MNRPTEAELEAMADEIARIGRDMRTGVQVVVIVFPSPLQSGDPVVTRAYGFAPQIAQVLKGEAVSSARDLREQPLPEKGRAN